MMANRSLFGITREVLKDLTTCKLCFEEYDEVERQAKYLPCLHSFCLFCLVEHAKGERVFKCPMCRRSTNVPENGVRGLPDNFIVGTLTDLQPVVNNADPSTILRCGSCTDEENVSAVGFCLACQAFLCRTCKEAHSRMRAFDGHEVKTMEQLQNPSTPPQQGSYCDQHKRERLTLFCTGAKCQKVLCILCAQTRHQGQDHPTVELAVRSAEVMRDMNNLVEQARHKATLVREISGKINTEINRTSRLYEESANAVNRFFEALQEKLKERVTNANIFQNQVCVDRTNLLRRQTDRAESIISQFESACQFAETACGTGNPVHLLWAKEQVFAKLEELINLNLAKHIPFQPTSEDVFKSLTADQEWALEEFEKIFQRLGIFTKSICNYDFEVDLAEGKTFSLITEALQVVRLRLSDKPGQSLENLIDRLDAFIVSPDGNSTDCAILRMSDTDIQGCEVQVQPMVSGTHKLNISVSGVPIKHSPFFLEVADGPPQEPTAQEEISSDVTWNQKEISTDVTWNPDVFAGREHTIFVKLHGIREGQRLTARYYMQEDQSTNGLENDNDDEPIEDVTHQDVGTDARITSTADEGTFRVAFTPSQAGRLIMSIFLDDKPIPNQPFLVSVGPRRQTSPYSASIRFAQMGRHTGRIAVLDMPYSIVVSMHDYKRPLRTGGRSIIATIASGTSHQIQCVARDIQNGSYNIEFIPRSLGSHTLEITVDGQYLDINPKSFTVSRYLPFGNPRCGYISPTGIAVDKERNFVLVADGRQSCIHRLDLDGNDALQHIAISTKRSVQIATSKLGRLVMLIPAESTVILLSAFTKDEEQRWSCSSETTTPTNVFCSQDNKVIISDCNSQKLFVYDSQGVIISHIQLPEGSLTGSCMNNACCLPNNDVIVATSCHPYRIIRYTIAGTLKYASVSPANGDQLAVAALGEQATIVVSSAGKVMILALHPNGSSTVVSEFKTERIYTSLGSTADGCFMAFDPGEGFHLDKYSYREYPDEEEGKEVLV
ncbi:uncharacterized protein LOC117301312 [Asterias rubens]|uniref:uncharacterized protein LOC117301312 n=1 Tax=Asterias rubens TaxID=7604 RepID=UPI001454E673|nr:uncharacterized protein LOC117301312 [Asterias rubens]